MSKIASANLGPGRFAPAAISLIKDWDVPTSPASHVKVRPDVARHDRKSLMAINITRRDMHVKGQYRPSPKDTEIVGGDNALMAKTRIYFREWRKHRGLNQERAAARMGVSQGHLSDLENNKKAWTKPVMEAMANAYSCEVWQLFRDNPLIPDADVAHIIDVSRVPEAQRPVIRQLVASLARETG